MGVYIQYKPLFDLEEVAEKETTLLNMREKIKEYISELCEEVDRCEKWISDNMDGNVCKVAAIEARIQALLEVKCDLESKLNEVV